MPRTLRTTISLLLAAAVVAGVVAIAPPVTSSAAATTVALPDSPRAMVFSPSGHRLYTTSFSGNSVSIINPATGAVLDTISVKAQPTSIALSPDGTTLVTGHAFARGLSVITLATGAVRDIAFSDSIDAVMFSADGRSLYYTSAGYSIGVRTVPAFTEGTAIPMPQPVSGLQRQPGSSSIWTSKASPLPNALYRVNPATRTIDAALSTGSLAARWAFPAGNERLFAPASSGLPFVGDLSSTRAVPMRQMQGSASGPIVNLATTLDRGLILATTLSDNMLVIDPLSERVIDEIVIGEPQYDIAVRPGTGDVWIAVDGGLRSVSAPARALATLGPSLESNRLFGADRFATAVEISRAAFPTAGSAPIVYLASGLGFADALGAAPAAITQGGPILLTGATLPSAVRDELIRLDPARVVIVGGPGAVPAGVESAVRSALPGADVDRLQGATRYSTAEAVVRDAWPTTAPEVILATGRNFPDALSAGPYAGTRGAPLILVDGLRGNSANGQLDAIDAATRDLISDLDPDQRTIIGGNGSVSADILQVLTYPTFAAQADRRLWGSDRYRTSQHVNGFGFSGADTVYLASGLNFPDALAGSVLAGLGDDPLYIVPGTCVPRNVLAEIDRLGASSVVLLGGTGALSPAVEALTPCA